MNCPKCNGTGHIAAFSHIKNGQCFKCEGTGKVKGTCNTRQLTQAQQEAQAEKQDRIREENARLANLRAAGWIR